MVKLKILKIFNPNSSVIRVKKSRCIKIDDTAHSHNNDNDDIAYVSRFTILPCSCSSSARKR